MPTFEKLIREFIKTRSWKEAVASPDPERERIKQLDTFAKNAENVAKRASAQRTIKKAQKRLSDLSQSPHAVPRTARP